MADVFAYLYGFGAGGDFTKSVIIATAPTGSTVTCTKGTTVKTATEKNGEWWFKGLEIGTWTLKATLSGQTATQTVNVAQFGVYRVAMSYFKATIKVTYPAGSTCTCSKGGEVLTAPNTSGSHTFTVTSAGTWTVRATDGDRTKSETVRITASGQSKSVTLSYEIVYISGGVFKESYKTYSTAGELSVTPVDGYINLQGTANGRHVLYFDPVDFGEYSTVSIDGKFYSLDDVYTDSLISVGVYRNLSDLQAETPNPIAYSTLLKKTSVDLDISSVSGTGYVAVRAVNKVLSAQIANLKIH